MRLTLFAVVASMLTLPLAARADWMGDSVDVQVAYPEANATFDDLGTFTVPGFGFDNGVAQFILGPSQVTIISQATQTFLPADFLGLTFTDITKNPGIVSATLESGSNLPLTSLTFTSNEVLVNFAGETVQAGQFAIIDLSFASPASVTPEPTSIALLGTGLLGMAGVVRRRFAQA